MRAVILILCLLPSVVFSSDYLIGEVKARASVNVIAQIDGLVSSIHTEFGEQVRHKQVLLELDQTDAKLALALAKANLDLARVDSELKDKQLQRLKALNANNSVSDSDLEEQLRQARVSHAQLRIEQQNINIAQRQLDKHLVLAPFSARVIERYVELGQWVNTGEPLYRLADISSVLVQARLVEQDVAELQVGQMVDVFIPSVEKRLQAKTLRIADAPERVGGGYRVELELENPDGLIKPGYRVELTVPEGVQE